MFDFNCDLAQSHEYNRIKDESEIAKYVSSVNICAGLYAGSPLDIKNALEFAATNERAVGAHIGYDNRSNYGYTGSDLSPEELEALVLAQISTIGSYAKVYGLEIEYVRLHGAMYTKLNEDIEFAKLMAKIIKKFNPWLTLIVGNYDTKKTLEEEYKLKCSYEVTFGDNSSIRELREMENQPQTVHFTSLENIKRAHDVIKPTPVAYNRVALEL